MRQLGGVCASFAGSKDPTVHWEVPSHPVGRLETAGGLATTGGKHSRLTLATTTGAPIPRPFPLLCLFLLQPP